MRHVLPVLLALLATDAAGCGDSSTTTSPSSTTTSASSTVTFASELVVHGSATRSFTTSTGGTIKLTLTTLGNGTPTAGIGIGLAASGAPCSLAQSAVTGPGADPQVVISADAGSYCVQVYDPGSLSEDTPFSLTVEHP
jgi:hypothetical protein